MIKQVTLPRILQITPSPSAARILEFAYVLNAVIVHKGPFSNFSIFAPLHAFFALFKKKIGIYDLDVAYSKQPLNIKGEFDF